MFKNNKMKFKGKSTLTKQGFSFPKEINELCLLSRFIHKHLITFICTGYSKALLLICFVGQAEIVNILHCKLY